ncbi:MAG: UDP-N-acetylmuramate--L-alanine ligase [Spirochaetaceae bacterium]|jgi:UDP-N-acetylmuramate--alanine ligase|nr:UDP-N-acetylmuramate--L-alanine ligase [Spirochaetaceae bacterium]
MDAFAKILESGSPVYFIGIKGTGMCALAELLHGFFGGGAAAAKISGSDTSDVFYTDAILKELGIPYYESFDAAHIPEDAALVIHSAAYSAESNSEVREAVKRGLPLLKYTEALGAYSALFEATGIAGVHGKTTTTALAGTLLKKAKLPAQVLAGSAVSTFNGRSTLSLGNKYFIAETCEYRNHFLSFHPTSIILTSIESDHQDFFPTYESIRDAFLAYIRLLPEGGCLIYCADDAGAREAAEIIKGERGDIHYTEYGRTAQGDYRILSSTVENERSLWTLAGFRQTFTLRVPGDHNVLNASAALALFFLLVKKERGTLDAATLDSLALEAARALEEFRGSKRRSEIVGEVGGVLFMDDYAHHPSAIKTTLAGLKLFYPSRRIVVSFMSHTYTRTAALLDEFASAFSDADILILHKIYASARENFSGGVHGRTLFERVRAQHANVIYFEEPLDAASFLRGTLQEGDICITMGAGDNWQLGKSAYDDFLGGEQREKKNE